AWRLWRARTWRSWPRGRSAGCCTGAATLAEFGRTVVSIAPASSSLRLTAEQEAIVSHEPTSNLVVSAFAGSGKTSTLVEFARRWSSYRGLYLAFNSAIQR